MCLDTKLSETPRHKLSDTISLSIRPAPFPEGVRGTRLTKEWRRSKVRWAHPAGRTRVLREAYCALR